MNQRNYFNDLFYDRKKVSMALAVITAAILIVAFLVFGGQGTSEQDSSNQPTSQQQNNTPEEHTQSDTTTQTPQSSEESTSSEDSQMQDAEPGIRSGVTEVSYTANGFTPEHITVRAGTTVHFINDSEQSMRVESISESNSTQAYMFFQQPSTISTGERYVFVFNDPGTLVYHNLNKPRHTGTIVVVE